MLNAPLHVCHVLPTLGAGGMENGVVNIVNGLDPHCFRSTVICLHEGGLMAERIDRAKTRLIILHHPDRLAPELPLRLARLFKELEPELVHTRNYTANLYGTLGARLARVPTVINGEHGMIQRVGWRKKLTSRLVSLLSDRVLCVSPGLHDYLSESLRYPADTLVMIQNGVDLSRFDSEKEDGLTGRRELGIPEDVWLIGSVGRFYPFKDHPVILSLLEHLPEVGGRPLHACIFGSGEREQEFKAQVAERGLSDRVHLPGFRQDVNRFYSVFDVFLLLSTGNEGTSNAVLEAMAGGLPIVTTRIPGNRHLIENGWNGILVPPEGEAKIQALARLVPDLLRDQKERQRLGANAKAFVQKQFGLQGMIDRYAHFYSSLVH